MAKIARRCLIGVLLTVHAAMLAWAATLHTPVLDETGHLPAGLAFWRFHRADLYPHNPPLVKAIAALPVMVSGYTEDWSHMNGDPLQRRELVVGRDFIEANGSRAFWLFTLARWACIPFSLLGGLVCYLWAKDLYGSRAGVVSLTLWCFCPNIIGNAQFITPDVGATALGFAACYVFWKSLRAQSWVFCTAAGLLLGGANLCKFTWIILFPLWWVAWSTRQIPQAAWCDGNPPRGVGKVMWFRALRHIVVRGIDARIVFILCMAVVIINAGYGFRRTFSRLDTLQFFSRSLSGYEALDGVARGSGNRFRNTWLGRIPVPLPRDYLQGLDLQRRDFELGYQAYLRGQWREGGWWYYYLYALAIKTPIGTLVLAFAVVAWRARRGFADHRLADELFMLAPALIVLAIASWQTGINMFLRYVLPVFPAMFVWSGSLLDTWAERDLRTKNTSERWRYSLALVLITWAVASSLSCFPHSASYFNEFVGGPRGGPDHLLDSNVGWGQDLFFLKKWCDAHPEAMPLGLACAVNLNPRLAGIDYYRAPESRRSANHRCPISDAAAGPRPGWFAIDVTFAKGRRGTVTGDDGKPHVLPAGCDYSYFQYFQPVARAGYSIYIYEITCESANGVRRRLGLGDLPEDAMQR